ncbi:Helicase, C-terminal, partial [Dillenia turbinata]
MKRKRLYRSRHPIDAYPFEAFACGSWQPVELIRIRDGKVTLNFLHDSLMVEERGPPSNFRLRSRKATLSDCTCFLRPGTDVCVLSASQNVENSDEESIEPAWLDARINSIERKPHEPECTCKFYVNFYTDEDPVGMEKRAVSTEVTIVEIDKISIFQVLKGKPCENEPYRWKFSEDCPSVGRTKLFIGKFLSDFSWLLVASVLKKTVFDVRSEQNKIVYKILGGNHHILPSSLDAVTFRVENEVSIPMVYTLPSANIVEAEDLNSNSSEPKPLAEFMELRRSNRRNVQPDRFFSLGGFNESDIGSFRVRSYFVTKWAKEDDEDEDKDEDMVYLNADGENISSYEDFLVSKCEVKRRDTSSGNPFDSSQNNHLAIVPAKGQEETDKTYYKKCQFRVKECTPRLNRNDTSKAESEDSDDIPLKHYIHVKNGASKVNRNDTPKEDNTAKSQEKSEEVSSKHHSRVDNYFSAGNRNNNTLRPDYMDIESIEIESRWEWKSSYRRRHGRRLYSFPTKRPRSSEKGTERKKYMTTTRYNELIKKYIKNIESTINETNPSLVDPLEDIQATERTSEKSGKKKSVGKSDENVDDGEDSETEMLWREMELALAQTYILGDDHCSNIDASNKDAQKSGEAYKHCKHEFKLNEEMGIFCLLCGFVSTEIKDVSPDFVQSTASIRKGDLWNEDDLEPTAAEDWDKDMYRDPASSEIPSAAEGKDSVWGFIPELRTKLRLHQKKAFEFLWKNISGSLIPDEMDPAVGGGCVISHSPGAGKTLLIISFLVSYLKLFPGKRPLVLAPKTTLYTWHKEIIKWEVPIPVYQIHGGRTYKYEIYEPAQKSRGDPKPNQDVMHTLDCLKKIQKWHAHPSILLMGYPSFLSLMREDSKFAHRRYMGKILRESPGILILDEGHNPRSTKSRLRKALMKVNTDLRILLSGTLFQNNFGEYFNTLALARPMFVHEVLRSLDPKFKKNKKAPKMSVVSKENRARKYFLDKIARKIDSSDTDERTQGLNMLRNMTNGFIDVYENQNADDLPGLENYIIMIKSKTAQHEILKKLQSERDACDKRFPLELEHLIILAAIHPCLLKSAICATRFFSKEDLDELESQKFDLSKGSKVKFVVNLVHRCIFKNEKVLIFCHNISPINLFLEIFEWLYGWRKGEEVLILQGDLELFERGRVMDKFEEPGGVSKVLLASITACGEGISLTAASRVILLDSEWNPSKRKQAIARAFRPGQEKMVYVYQLLATGTLEEYKHRRTAWKEWVSHMIFSEEGAEGSTDSQTKNIEDNLLREIVEEDQEKSFHMIMKSEKASHGMHIAVWNLTEPLNLIECHAREA